jgi:hypothetical protein
MAAINKTVVVALHTHVRVRVVATLTARVPADATAEDIGKAVYELAGLVPEWKDEEEGGLHYDRHEDIELEVYGETNKPPGAAMTRGPKGWLVTEVQEPV